MGCLRIYLFVSICECCFRLCSLIIRPFLLSLRSTEVDSALANMYSYARPMDQGGHATQMDSATLLRKHIEKQNEILADDDIADDDDDSDGGEMGGMQPATTSHTSIHMPPAAVSINMPNVSSENGMGANIMERKMPAVAQGQPQKSVKFANTAPTASDVIVID